MEVVVNGGDEWRRNSGGGEVAHGCVGMAVTAMSAIGGAPNGRRGWQRWRRYNTIQDEPEGQNKQKGPKEVAVHQDPS